MRWQKPELLLDLARRLAGSGEGLTLDEMAREAGCGRRTVERMRDALRVMFPQMEELFDGRAKRFRIPGGLDGFLQMPAVDELAELDVAARHLAATGHCDRADLLRSLDRKIRSALKATGRLRIEPDLEALLAAEELAMQAGPRPMIERDVLAKVRAALKAGRSLKCRYGAATGRWRRIEPWGLLFGRQPYIVGPAAGMVEPVLWRLDRVRDLDLGDFMPAPPAGFSLAGYAARSFGAYQEEQEDIALRFSAEAASDARRWLFHPSQTIEEGADGSLLIRFRAGGLRELVDHLFTWDDAVEILAPSRIKVMMIERLRQASARHGA